MKILVFKSKFVQLLVFHVKNVSKFWFLGCQVTIFPILDLEKVKILVFKSKFVQLLVFHVKKCVKILIFWVSRSQFFRFEILNSQNLSNYWFFM